MFNGARMMSRTKLRTDEMIRCRSSLIPWQHPPGHIHDNLVSFVLVSSLKTLAHCNALLSVPLIQEEGLTSLAASAVFSDK